jgi:4-amino-4-deoxy-L-arabinose transferase-like glycosyltransferase
MPEDSDGPLKRWILPSLIFLLAFLPRALYPVSRSMLWYYRAIHFSDALLARNWAETYQSPHPGVTTMWLSGIGVRVFGWRRGLSSAQLLGIEPTIPGTVNAAITAGVAPLALITASCIILCYFLLKRCTNHRVALAGSCLIALDPFLIANSKVLHVDGLLTMLMITSALFLFNYVRGSRWRDLVLGGAGAGLAFLTKTPSLFLVPYTGLTLATWTLMPSSQGFGASIDRQEWRHRFERSVRAFLIWGAAASILFVVVWPAMWVQPLDVLRWMRDRTLFHAEQVHIRPVFFNGEATYEDPGLPFYLATMAWKTTLVTLPMAVLGLVSAALQLRRRRVDKTTWLLAVYALCFTLQMGLSSHKAPRYLLPVFPALDILAGIGLVNGAMVTGRLSRGRRRHWLPAALIALGLGVQAAVVLPHHPYYGTHYNRLLGGASAAQDVLPLQTQGEGLDLAAEYLNSVPRASMARAMVYPLGGELFERSFLGFTSTGPEPWTDYRVYYANQVQRNLGGEEWDKAWDADKDNTPLWSLAFDGVPYVWVYGAPPEAPAADGPEYEGGYQLGEHIQLKRYRLSEETLAPGDTLTVALVWETDAQIHENYTVFCHLLSKSGELIAQRDSPPVYGVRPTPSWRAGEVIEDGHEVFLDDSTPPGEYGLSVGMYEPETMKRVPAYAGSGERLPEDRIVLRSVLIQIPHSSSD